MDSVPAPLPLPRSAATALIGRERERVFLREELNAARSGQGRLVLLGGEAGIGKTTLARDLIGAAQRENVQILVGHCFDLGSTPPYGPWLDLTSSYRPNEQQPSLPEAFANGQLEGVRNQAALFAEVLAYFAALARSVPVVVVLEDMHWADPSSLELLRFLAAQIGELALLLLVTYRVDELTRAHPFYRQLPSLVRGSGGLRLDLRGLGTGDLLELVRARYRLTTDDELRLVDYLARHADGNPLFATELIRALEEERLLRPTGDGWTLGTIDRVVVPALLNQVIDARIDRLGEETRRLLAMASVIGQEVPLDLWAEVGNLDEDALIEVAERAVDAHIMEADRDPRFMRFVHALTRDTLYENIVPPRRRSWHRRVADALLLRPQSEPDVVAYHLQAAGDVRAPEWLTRAGERAQRAYAWLTAADRFRAAATELTFVPGQEEDRGWLLYRAARLLRLAQPTEGIALVEEAERLGRMANVPLLIAEARYSRGLLKIYAGATDVGCEEMASGIELMESTPIATRSQRGKIAAFLADSLPEHPAEADSDVESADRLLASTGIYHRRGGLPWFLAAAGRFDKSIPMGESFVEQASAMPNPGGLVRSAMGHACQGLGIAYAGMGRPQDSRQAFLRAREIYRDLDHHGVIAICYLAEMRSLTLVFEVDRPEGRRSLAREAVAAFAQAGGAMPIGTSARMAEIACLILDGEWDQALEIITDVPENRGNVFFEREIAEGRSTIAYYRGDRETAWREIRAALPAGPDTMPGSHHYAESLHFLQLAADLSLDGGDLDGAARWLTAHDRWSEWTGGIVGQVEGYLGWARHALLAGDLAKARECAESALTLAASPRQPLELLAAHQTLGRICRAAGESSAARAHLDKALALARTCELPYERAMTLLELADLASSNQDTGLSASLEEAREILARLDARPALERLNKIADRKDESQARAALPFGLTARELEVLRFVSQGMTDSAAAAALFISPRTVSQHLRSIYGKLDVSSRAGATRIAIERSLI